jgi:hypothetical protein
MLWIDEALFTICGVYNPLLIPVEPVIDDYLIGLRVIQDHLDEVHEADFPEEMLPLLLEDVPLHVSKKWFLHDGAPPQFTCNVQLA